MSCRYAESYSPAYISKHPEILDEKGNVMDTYIELSSLTDDICTIDGVKKNDEDIELSPNSIYLSYNKTDIQYNQKCEQRLQKCVDGKLVGK